MADSSSAQFTTRARVVDLLGREQIADAPTAMGELFKNSIDAAASKVQIDYWQKQRCLVVSDDGLGMRADEEVIGKWLVLATDSKLPGNGPPSDWMKFATEEQKKRLEAGKVFGQKGIGRLAIALLGTGTLVWTRWGDGIERQRTLLLVPWSVFRHPKLTLDQIKLPMLRLDRPATMADALQLVEQAHELMSSMPSARQSQAEQLSLLRDDLTEKFRHSLTAPIAFPDTPGTMFIVLNTDDIVANHFEGWLGKEDIFADDDSFNPEGPKAYLAFNNPFSETGPRLALDLRCDGHLSKATTATFWRRTDFDRADHYVKVSINENGFARGRVRRFNEEIDYEKQLPNLPNRSMSPGMLHIEIGEIEGDMKNSRLKENEFVRYYTMLSQFGGFYVYMNDIRVCPYGRDDSDFVQFEKRRSINAGRHFWSARRMFGGVFLNREENESLIEKAGREGFQQNGAYRGLVHYLQALFLDLADSYFGSKADRPDKKARQHEKEKKEREERQGKDREDFLQKFAASKKFIDLVSAKFTKAADTLEKQLADAELGMPEMLIGGCREGLAGLRNQFQNIWEGMVTQFPTSFSLSPEDAEAVDYYLHRRTEIDMDAQARLKQLSLRLEKLAAKTEAVERRKKRQQEALDNARTEIIAKISSKRREILNVEERLRHAINEQCQKDIVALDKISDVGIEKEGVGTQESEGTIEELIARTTRHFQEVLLPRYELILAQISSLIDGDGGLLEAADLREELRLVRERERHLLELAQLGLVIESADHDYRSMLSDADKAIDALGRAIPDSSRQSLQTLKDALQHIDEQLQAFDPLVRRVRGRITEVSGDDIRQFLQSAFDRVRRPTVVFEYTPKFLAATFCDLNRPVFLGAIHNLVMNAGYWASKARPQGQVRFSMATNGFIISDSGNGVHLRDRDRIFEPGFSRRPAGRGLGLFIARSCLQAFGYGLELLPVPAPGALTGANFLVSRQQGDEHELD
jgi:signal transduction histidine kinase